MFIFTHILLKHISFDGSLSASTTIFSVQLDPVKRSAANSRKRQVSQKMAPSVTLIFFSILPTGVSCDHHGLNRWVVERFESYRLVIWIFARLSATNALCKFSLLPRNDNSWPPPYIFHNFTCRKKKISDGQTGALRDVVFGRWLKIANFFKLNKKTAQTLTSQAPKSVRIYSTHLFPLICLFDRICNSFHRIFSKIKFQRIR